MRPNQVLFAVLILCGIVSARTLPAVSNQQQTPANQKDNAGAPSMQSSASLAFGLYPSVPPPAENNSQDKPSGWPPASDAFWSNWALVLISGGAVVAALKTLKVIREQTADAKAAALSAKETADAAKVNADAALTSANAIINSERAWVVVHVAWSKKPRRIVQFGDKCNIHVTWVFENAGKTLARIYETSICLYIGSSIPAAPDFNNTLLVTENTFEALSYGKAPPEEKSVRGQGFLGREKNTTGILFGRVRYLDIFGNKRYTVFGYYFFDDRIDGLERLSPQDCPAYNEYT
jgi:hypothetical protein